MGLLFPLGLHLTLGFGVERSLSLFLFLVLSKNRLSFAKTNLSFYSPVIFHDFVVELLSGHSGICETPRGVTRIRIGSKIIFQQKESNQIGKAELE